MKKIIALALALIMALSMASVAFAASEVTIPNQNFTYGQKVKLALVNQSEPNEAKRSYKVSYDFTSAKEGFKGASLIDTIEIDKEGNLCINFKENLTSVAEKEYAGKIVLTHKTAKEDDGKTPVTITVIISGKVANNVEYIEGVKKAADAEVEANISDLMAEDTVLYAEDGAGYVYFTDDYALEGVVKVADDEKAQVYVLDKNATEDADEDLVDAVEAYLDEDYDAIVEWYNFCGTGFKSDVAFSYDAYAEDPHFFYAWDGEKFVEIEAKFNDDEDVEKYEFTAPAKGLIIVTDVEIVAAAEEEETKNPDTGANDVVGVAAALAVVSLVAAGAVSLKK